MLRAPSGTEVTKTNQEEDKVRGSPRAGRPGSIWAQEYLEFLPKSTFYCYAASNQGK